MAKGLVKAFPAIVKPVLEFCLANDLNVFQMPCPELACPAGGLSRELHGKGWYEERGLRQVCADIAGKEVARMLELIEDGFEVLGILGVEFSPACAVTYLNRGRRLIREQGIYVEELEREMSKHGLKFPIIGVNPRWHKKLARDLDALVQVASDRS